MFHHLSLDSGVGRWVTRYVGRYMRNYMANEVSETFCTTRGTSVVPGAPLEGHCHMEPRVEDLTWKADLEAKDPKVSVVGRSPETSDSETRFLRSGFLWYKDP